MRYEGQTFRDRKVEMDGNEFFECHFERVALVIRGEKPTIIEGCVFYEWKWELAGPAMMGIEAIRMLVQSAGSGAVNQAVQDVTKFLQTPLPKESAQLVP